MSPSSTTLLVLAAGVVETGVEAVLADWTERTEAAWAAESIEAAEAAAAADMDEE